MRVVAVSCIRNEVDIVEAFVRHTLATANAHLILDHSSTDGTREVLEALEAEGLPLVISESNHVALQQVLWCNELANRAVRDHGADWVLSLDADEFLSWPEGAPLLEERAPELRHYTWRTYVPTDLDDPNQPNPLLRIGHRLAREARPWTKVVVPAAVLRAGGQLDEGSHNVVFGGSSSPGALLAERDLLHFPARSLEQFSAKIAVGWLQALLIHGGHGGNSVHYKDAFEQLRDQPARFAESWRDHVRGFAAIGEPVPEELVLDPARYRGGPLRYTPALDDQQCSFSSLLNWAELAARELFTTRG